MAIFKRNHLFQTIILGIHVSFRGCIAFVPSTGTTKNCDSQFLMLEKNHDPRVLGSPPSNKNKGDFWCTYIPGSLNHPAFLMDGTWWNTPVFLKHLRIWSHIIWNNHFSRGCFGVLPGTHFYQKKPVVSGRVSILSGRQFLYLDMLYISFTWIHRTSNPNFFGGHLFNFSHLSWLFCSFSKWETCPTKPIRNLGSQTPQKTTSAKFRKLTKLPVRPFGPCRSSTSEWTNTSLEVRLVGEKHVFLSSPCHGFFV